MITYDYCLAEPFSDYKTADIATQRAHAAPAPVLTLCGSFFSFILTSNVSAFDQLGPYVPTTSTETLLFLPAHSALPQSQHIVLSWKEKKCHAL